MPPKGVEAPRPHRPTGAAGRRTPEELDEMIHSVLAGSRRPLSAYQVIEQMAQLPKPLAPMQIYRMMQRLVDAGRARRIETLSAYVAIKGDVGALAVCDQCGLTVSLPREELGKNILQALAANGFAARRQVIEAFGFCGDCAPQAK